MPKRLKDVIGFLKAEKLGIFAERKIEITKSGKTIPKTYIKPIRIAPNAFGERRVKVKMPTKTGAQQALAIPEKTPSKKIEIISVFPSFALGVEPLNLGIGNFMPKNDSKATINSIIPPRIYNMS